MISSCSRAPAALRAGNMIRGYSPSLFFMWRGVRLLPCRRAAAQSYFLAPSVKNLFWVFFLWGYKTTSQKGNLVILQNKCSIIRIYPLYIIILSKFWVYVCVCVWAWYKCMLFYKYWNYWIGKCFSGLAQEQLLCIVRIRAEKRPGVLEARVEGEVAFQWLIYRKIVLVARRLVANRESICRQNSDCRTRH